jgi:hypothetical protein
MLKSSLASLESGSAGARSRGRGLELVEQPVNRREPHFRIGEIEIESQFVLTVQPEAARMRLDQPDQHERLDPGVAAEQQAAAGGIGLDAPDAESRRALADRRDAEQRLRRQREQAEAIDQLDLQFLEGASSAAPAMRL